jgi:hypothetical protein
MCSDALEDEPECVPLMIIRARAHIALRRDLDAQADLRDIIRLDPQCGIAYRLLGELAARRDENESAAIFFREAVRLDPDDHEAADWLLVIDASIRPAAVAKKLPAPAAAAGRFPRAQSPSRPIREPDTDPMQTVEARPARVARGTYPPADEHAAIGPYDERPTRPFARGSNNNGESWKTPAMMPRKQAVTPAGALRVLPLPAPMLEMPTMQGRPQPPAPVKEAPKLAPPRRPVIARAPTPELPGFGEYLVTSGILTRERLRAAQAYQRSMRVQLSTAIVTLGLATPQRIEWAAVAHQSQLAREQR